VLSQLAAITGWAFVAATGCIFAAVAVIVHAVLDVLEKGSSPVEEIDTRHLVGQEPIDGRTNMILDSIPSTYL
jgi:hypothetical protein